MAGAKALEARVEGDHLLSHAIAGEVGIEAAIDKMALREQMGKPTRIGPGVTRRNLLPRYSPDKFLR
jgi:hypothetical protein